MVRDASRCHRGGVAPAEILAGAVDRTVLTEHAGMSGAGLERVRLADGRAVVVKRVTPATDLTLGLTGGTVAWELTLWRSGALDRLPPGVGHAILDGWTEGADTTVLVMRDLGGSVLTWDDRLSTERCRWLLRRLAALDERFLGAPPEGLVPLRPVLELFAPHRIRDTAAAGNRLCAAALRGWEYFADPGLVPSDVADVVLGLLADVGPLAAALSARPVTLVHGDLATVNMAFEGDDLVLLDWAMPTAAPAALDVARFLVGCAHVVEPDRDGILALHREAAGAAYDEEALRLALLSAVVWLGWNKTLDIVESKDEAVRARETTDLAWWVREVRKTMESGVL